MIVAQQNSNLLENRQTLAQTNQPHTIKQFVQEPVLRKLFDRVWGPLDNVLFEPIALALRKSGTTRDFMYAMGCERQLRALHRSGNSAQRGERYRHVVYQISLQRMRETSESAENH